MFGHRWRSFRRDVDGWIGRLLGVGVGEEPIRGMLAGMEDLEGLLRREFAHGCTAP